MSSHRRLRGDGWEELCLRRSQRGKGQGEQHRGACPAHASTSPSMRRLARAIISSAGTSVTPSAVMSSKVGVGRASWGHIHLYHWLQKHCALVAMKSKPRRNGPVPARSGGARSFTGNPAMEAAPGSRKIPAEVFPGTAASLPPHGKRHEPAGHPGPADGAPC